MPGTCPILLRRCGQSWLHQEKPSQGADSREATAGRDGWCWATQGTRRRLGLSGPLAWGLHCLWHSGPGMSVTPASQPDSHAPNLPGPFLWILRELSSGRATETTTLGVSTWPAHPHWPVVSPGQRPSASALARISGLSGLCDPLPAPGQRTLDPGTCPARELALVSTLRRRGRAGVHEGLAGYFRG